MEQDIFIDGIGISNYRSFGPEVQRIGPFAKVNLMVGRNNSGKSNILLFLRDQYTAALKRQKMPFEDLDYHDGNRMSKQIVEVGLKTGSENYKRIIERFDKSREHPSNLAELIEAVLHSQSLTKGTGVAWFRYIGEGNNALDPELLSAIYAAQVITNKDWVALHNIFTRSRFMRIPGEGQIKSDCVLQTLRWLSPCNLEPPKVSLVPAIRSVREGPEKADDFSGLGIIDKLARLQNASYKEPDKKKRFERINEFVQSVLGNRSAILHVPYERNTIEVEMDGRPLPLSNLGTGVHEVIILAAAATVLEKQVVCIEEPELHCHPLLQKQLVKYLQEKTDNQYFISTHSAHLLDTTGTGIFHVRYADGQSIVDPVFTDMQKSRICDDLGYRASDLLQANCVIWVEGPSDRIYLNHWIHAVEPELVERLHYSIMFYGGRLLSHLTADDQEISDFISLRHLNRHIAIVIDSDRSGPQESINDTKKRIQSEFDNEPGFAWVTEGREIENYVDLGILEGAVKDVCREATTIDSNGAYDNCLGYKSRKGEICSVDKVKVANSVTSVPANLDVLDLKKMVEKLVDFIREANDLVE